ncbi:glutathione S-transferase [Zoogloea oryzae]|uniref:Glutathione S-transferase n=1 Tax=Zoogloea oryzae TaxID=310767 RepID=A0ABQ6FD51_9RHOO|nr:glutathione S-transferase family protein [Zoogloea oryzae]GLT23162.1 glutathione S-transferase [Zoogloea oryzae]
MKLVGMLDSPFVRRTFISARMLGVPFEHQSLSVFRNFVEFHAINPLVKAPTLVLDDGGVMVDSSLIIDWFERTATPGKSLLPADAARLQRCLQLTSWGLAAAEKSVQRYYETKVRPEEARSPDWIDRVTGQIRDTYALIDRHVGQDDWLCGDRPTQADITVAVAWRFTHHTAPGLVDDSDYPHLAGLAAQAEGLPAFRAADFT